MRTILISAIASTIALSSVAASAQEVAPPQSQEPITIKPSYDRNAVRKTGSFELGVRLAYSAPIGNIAKDSPFTLPGMIGGAVPVWIDIGGRIGQYVYIGAYAEIAPGFAGRAFKNTASSAWYGENVKSSTALKAAFGANVHVHILPRFVFDPWVGVGFGAAAVGASAKGEDGSTYKAGFVGYEGNVQAGGDYRVTKYFGIGPFVSFAFGKYAIGGDKVDGEGNTGGEVKGQQFHEWFTGGVRGTFNL